MEKQVTAIQQMINWNEARKDRFNKWRQDYLDGKHTGFVNDQTYNAYSSKVFEIEEQIEALKEELSVEKNQLMNFSIECINHVM